MLQPLVAQFGYRPSGSSCNLVCGRLGGFEASRIPAAITLRAKLRPSKKKRMGAVLSFTASRRSPARLVRWRCCESVRRLSLSVLVLLEPAVPKERNNGRMTLDSRWVVLSGLGVALLGLGASWNRGFTREAVTALSAGQVGRLLAVVFLVGMAGIVVSLTTRYELGGFWLGTAAAVVGCLASSMFLIEGEAEPGPVITLLGSGTALAFGVNEIRGWTLRPEQPRGSIPTCGTLLVAAAAVVVAGGVLPLVSGAGTSDAAINSITWWPSGLLAFGALVCGANARRPDIGQERQWTYVLYGSLAMLGSGTFSWLLIDVWQQLGLSLRFISYGIALPAAASLSAPVFGLLASDNLQAESFEITAPVQAPQL